MVRMKTGPTPKSRAKVLGRGRGRGRTPRVSKGRGGGGGGLGPTNLTLAECQEMGVHGAAKSMAKRPSRDSSLELSKKGTKRGRETGRGGGGRGRAQVKHGGFKRKGSPARKKAKKVKLEEEVVDLDHDTDEDSDGDEEWEVLKIVGHRYDRRGNLEFNVMWKPGKKGEVWPSTWEPESNCANCPDSVDEYWQAKL